MFQQSSGFTAIFIALIFLSDQALAYVKAHYLL